MSYNGSGTFVINSTGQPVVFNTVIDDVAFNALTADLATGLTNALCKDGQSTPTANIKMGGFKITGLAAGTASGDVLSYGQTGAKLGITNARFTSLAGPNYSTTSATFVMCGFGSSWAITPNLTGRVRFRCNGMLQNSTSGDVATVNPSYGTGTAPLAGVTVTGTQPYPAAVGGTVTGANGVVPFSAEVEVTGLTLSTAYWFDFAIKAGGGTATVNVLWVLIEEF